MSAVKLLVSTPLNILGFDTETHRLDILASGDGEYYGISWNSTGSQLALSHSAIDNDALTDIAAYAQSERGFISIAGEASRPFLSAPHQILWVDDEWVVATNTGRNAIAKLRVRDGALIQDRYDGPLWDRLTPQGTEGSHYNSLFYRDGVLYAAAHNFDKGSYILLLEWPTMRQIDRVSVPASGIHNFWIDPAGRWITCDSPNGALMDARSGERLWSNGKEGYLRGLAAAGSSIFAGVSLAGPRHNRLCSETGIWLVDADRWEALDYYDLGRFGGVHEIRIADRPDLCHNGVPLSEAALGWMAAAKSAHAAKRLEKVRRAQAGSSIWVAHLGDGDCLDQPIVQPSPGEFLLGSLRQAGDGVQELTAELHLRRYWSRGDYAGLVAAFRGPGDTNMLAALFQRTVEGDLTASIWLERAGWQMLAQVTVDHSVGVPKDRLMGEGALLKIALRLVDGQAVLQVDGFTVLSLRDIPAIAGGSWGIRMFGQSFGLANPMLLPVL